jgi:hypothetical protein
MKAYLHLVEYSLSQDCTISVWDGEEWQVNESNDFKAITEAIESVEEAEIKIVKQPEISLAGWALVCAHGLEDDETVIDHLDNDFMQVWWEIYIKLKYNTEASDLLAV